MAIINTGSVLNPKFRAFNSRTNHSRAVGNNLKQTLRNEKTEFSNWNFNWNNDFIMFK